MSKDKRAYVCKDGDDFAEKVANHAFHSPDTRLGDLVVVSLGDDGLSVALNYDVYRAGQVYSVSSDQVIAELVKQISEDKDKQ